MGGSFEHLLSFLKMPRPSQVKNDQPLRASCPKNKQEGGGGGGGGSLSPAGIDWCMEVMEVRDEWVNRHFANEKLRNKTTTKMAGDLSAP